MNEKTAKQLRKIAKGLPVVWVIKNVIETVAGKNITREQRQFIPGKVHPEKRYRVNKQVTVKQDHATKIFTIYDLQGQAGVTKYVAYQIMLNKKQTADLAKHPHRHPESSPGNWQKFKKLLKKIFIYQPYQPLNN